MMIMMKRKMMTMGDGVMRMLGEILEQRRIRLILITLIIKTLILTNYQTLRLQHIKRKWMKSLVKIN